ncbi:MAG: hypothetical protein AB8H86_03240 [Polyangiales bacterium]
MNHTNVHEGAQTSLDEDVGVILSGTPKVRRRKAKRLAKKARKAKRAAAKRAAESGDEVAQTLAEEQAALAAKPLEIVELIGEPDEAVLDNVSAVLRDFYEVESASFAMARRGQSAPTPVIALRLHAKFQSRAGEIFDTVAEAASTTGVDAEVVLVNGGERIRSVRAKSFVFFPWRRRAVA